MDRTHKNICSIIDNDWQIYTWIEQWNYNDQNQKNAQNAPKLSPVFTTQCPIWRVGVTSPVSTLGHIYWYHCNAALSGLDVVTRGALRIFRGGRCGRVARQLAWRRTCGGWGESSCWHLKGGGSNWCGEMMKMADVFRFWDLIRSVIDRPPSSDGTALAALLSNRARKTVY